MSEDDEAAALAYQEQCEQEQWEMTQIDQIAAALAKAQAEMQNPGFDCTNPHFRNKYASLAAVRNAVVPVLARHGIYVGQNLTTSERGIGCETILTHSSGQSMRFGPLFLPASKADAQGFGSAATYARRYSLMAVAGVVGDEDDDANAATGKPAMVHSAKDDLPAVDPARVKVVADEISRAWSADVDEEARALMVFDVHEAVRGDQAVYAAAMDSAAKDHRNLKSGWRELVKKGREIAEQPAFRRAG